MAVASFSHRATMHAAPISFGQRQSVAALCRRPDRLSSRASLKQRSFVSLRNRPVSCAGLTQHSSSSSSSDASSDASSDLGGGGGKVGSSNPCLLHHHHQQQHNQQQLQPFTRPAWHPRLYGLAPSRRAGGLEAAARALYADVWNAGAHDALDELTTPGVCFHDALGAREGDLFSRRALRAQVAAFAAARPLLRFDLEDVFVDAGRGTAVVHYTLTAARLHAAGSSSSSSSAGVVSCVRGVDTLTFDRMTGRISGIVSVRERLAGELEEDEQQQQQEEQQEQELGRGQAAAGWGVL